MSLAWYARRLSRMSAGEIAWRGRDEVVKLLWRRLQVRNMGEDRTPVPIGAVGFGTPLAAGTATRIPTPARERLLAAADQLLASRWRVFSRERTDLGADPDWFAEMGSSRRAPEHEYALGINYRDSQAVGHVKYVWELSRHQHLTILGAAYYLSGDERYAVRAREHLVSWWERNPFLTGIHWTSGIEIGLRLLSWVWLRRLLHGWSNATELFEENPTFLRQLLHHQRFLATLPSHHTSANNHLIAEAAGLFSSACAFPFFRETKAWREEAEATLQREIAQQTFPCGLNRELATDYHLFVLELCLAAAVEGEVAGTPLGNQTWKWIQRMTDALAAIVDVRSRPPRQGDSDDAYGLLLDAPGFNRSEALLATGEFLFGRLPWWPICRQDDVRTVCWTALMPRTPVLPEREGKRPPCFPSAGLAFIRDRSNTEDEIWCRCDHGPLGYLATAAHGHADALSVEVRVGGVDVLADPGTYCYHGLEAWRSYFRSTRGHNTLELAEQDQSVGAGPFMWTRHASCRLINASALDEGPIAVWEAAHDGYRRLHPAAVHRRRVELNRATRRLTIIDIVDSTGEHACLLTFHCGPAVTCRLSANQAHLQWSSAEGSRSALLDLPGELSWAAVRGQNEPPMGWYSPSYDDKQPTTTLVGRGRVGKGMALRSRLSLADRFSSNTTNPM